MDVRERAGEIVVSRVVSSQRGVSDGARRCERGDEVGGWRRILHRVDARRREGGSEEEARERG